MEKAKQGYIRDMTIGNVWKHILVFAIPILIGNLFQEVYTMVDTMVAGRVLGDSAIAAIGATGALYNLIINLAMGMNNGCSLIITQRFGAHDEEGVRTATAGTLMLNAAACVLLMTLGITLMRPVLHAVNIPESIFEQSYTYILILVGGIFATVAYNTFGGILRAFGNSRTALVFLIISSVTNVGLDILMVAGLHMGVAGAAWATVIAQALSAVLSGLYMVKKYPNYMPKKANFRVPWAMMKDLIATGLSMAAMLSIVSLGNIMSGGALNRLGEKFITAKTAAIRWLIILTMPPCAMTGVASTFVGQNYGAGRMDRVRKGLSIITWLSIAWNLLSVVIVFTTGNALAAFTTGSADEEMLGYATFELRLMMPFTTLESVLLIFRGSMQAMGEKVAPVIASTMEMAYNLFSAFWVIPRFGFIGACFGHPIVWTLCAVFVMIVYFVKRRQWFAAPAAEQA